MKRRLRSWPLKDFAIFEEADVSSEFLGANAFILKFTDFHTFDLRNAFDWLGSERTTVRHKQLHKSSCASTSAGGVNKPLGT